MLEKVPKRWNEYFLLAVTIVQCLAIIFKCTEKTSHRRSNILAVDIVDAVCTSIFTLDCALRIFCLGLIRGKTSYLRSHKWNILDFFTTIDSWCLRVKDNQVGYPEQHCNLEDRGFTCPVGQTCVRGSNPNYGGTSFDFFPGALLRWVAPIIFVAYFILTAYIIINLIIAVILERTELTDAEKKKIQKDEFINFLKKRSSFGSTRDGTWVVGAVEGAQAGIKGLAKRMTTMRVTPISIRGKSLRLVKSGTSEFPLEAGNQLPDVASDSVSASDQSRDIGHSSNMETGIEFTNEESTNPQGPNRPTKRASQIIQSAGFPINISDQGGRGTALRSSVISLIRQESLVAQSAKVEQAESTDGGVKSLSTVKSIKDRASFVLAEFEGLMNINGSEAAPWYLDDTSLFIFSKECWFRKFCTRIIESTHYTKFYVLMVAVNIYLLAMTDADGKFMKSPAILHVVDCLAVAIFGTDVLLKCISYGFLLTPQPFLGHAYNVLDMFICIWHSTYLNFDNIGNAFLSLYVVSTFDDWVTGQLYPVMDISSRDHQPKRNAHPLYAIYFIAFVCIGGYFVMRMFVGVFIDRFGMISGSKLLTERQKLWRDTNRIIQHLRPLHIPEKPKNPTRRKIYRLVTSPYYGRFVAITVILNYVFLASHYSNQSRDATRIRRSFDAIFLLIYALDVCLMFTGLGPQSWVKDFWNIFELILVVGAATCLYPKARTLRERAGKFFKIMRIFRLIRYVPRLNTLTRTVIFSLSSMLDIFGLMFINLLVFAGVAVQLFANVKHGSCLNRANNFHTFTRSFVAVFQITTNDNWSCLWLDTRIEEPNCTQGQTFSENDCGNQIRSLIFFLSLNMSTTLIFMNLFIAGILDTITFGLMNENTMITPANLTDFQKLWSDPEFDPRGKGYIGLHKLRSFVSRLGSPLGRRHNVVALWYARIEWEAHHFRIEDKGLAFKDLLETLTLYKIGSRGLELAVRLEREKQVIQIYRFGAAIKIQALVRGFLQRRHFKQAQIKDDNQIVEIE